MSDDWSEFSPQPTTAAPAAPADTTVFGKGADPWADFTPVAGDSPSAQLFARSQGPTMSSVILGGPQPPDKYQQAAINQRDRLLANDVSLDEGYTRRLASGATFGAGDKAVSALAAPIEMYRHRTWDPREGYRYAKAKLDLGDAAARENTGLLGDVVETAGSLAALRGGNIFGNQLAARIGGAGSGVLPALARAGAYGLEGATIGAGTSAVGADTLDDAKRRALAGGIFGGLVGAPLGVFADVVPKTTAITPTADELEMLGRRGYRARDRLPVGYDADYVGDRAQTLQQATWNKYGRDAPQTADYLGTLADEGHNAAASARAANPNPPNSVAVQYSGAPNSAQAVYTPRDINSIRRETYDAGATGSATDERAGYNAGKVMERILTHPDPRSLSRLTSPRDAAAAAILHQTAKGNFAASFRANTVDNAIKQTLNDTATANSGLNFENRLRQNLNALDKKGEFDALTPTEQDAKEKLIRGTSRANTLRYVGNMLGGGGGLASMLITGGAAGGGAANAYMQGGNPWTGALYGALAGQTGRILRGAGNRWAESRARDFSELLRQRSPEYQSRVAVAPMQPGPGLPLAVRSVRNPLYFGGDTGRELRDNIAQSLMDQEQQQNAP